MKRKQPPGHPGLIQVAHFSSAAGVFAVPFAFLWK